MPRPVLFVCALLLGATLGAAGSPSIGAAPAARRRWDEKLDPFLRRAMLGVERRQGLFTDRLAPRSRDILGALPPFVRAERDADDPILQVKARVNADPDDLDGARMAARMQAAGAVLKGRAGDIVSLELPASAVEALAGIEEIRWLKAARGYTLTNEISTSSPWVASRDENTTFGNSGQGVIVVVFDTGIDFTDDDFRNPDGTTRILGIWDQTLSDGLHPPPAGYGFGAFYSKADIDDALLHGTSLMTRDGYGHGTHVAGTAAGNGRHTGNGVAAGTFAGVAPGADILIVRVFDNGGNFCPSCDLVAGTAFANKFAKAAGKPWVGNMSLGDPIGGAHDGTSPDELAIDAVVGPGRPGAQMSIAAGNEGSSSRHSHWEGTLASGATFTNNFTLSANTPTPGNNNDFVWLDLWYRGSDSATVEIQTPGGTVVSAARGFDSGVVCTTSGAVEVDATNAPDPENGDNEVFVQIWDSGACAPVVVPAAGSWTIRIVTNGLGGATGGTFDMWNQAMTPRSNPTVGVTYVTFSTFSLAKMISVPGSCKNAMTAGAYATKGSWINASGGTTTIPSVPGAGSIAPFSNPGPTRDGRIKPDVVAPGQYIGSSRSKDVTYTIANTERDGVHVNMQGTSMATPHLAGTMALLYAVNPALDGAQIRAAIQRSAIGDFQTGTVPNNRFGWGRLRALDGAYDAVSMVTGLGASTPSGTFSWGAAPTMNSWNVYRGPLPGITASNYGACFLSGLSSPGFVDSAPAPLNQGFFYLVTGVYTNPSSLLPVEGTLGTDSAGHIRPNTAPCP